jgi:putative tryptophan/tyrosine transport system substrate-binding protein
MQGLTSHFSKAFYLLLLSWASLYSFSVCAADNSILIIKSHENKFYNRTIEKLINTTEKKVKFNIITARAFEKNFQDYDPDIIVTLGFPAAEFSSKQMKDTPLIYGYITENQFNNLGSIPGHYSVLLDQPLERYLRFIELLLPDKKVGIIKTESSKLTKKDLKQLHKLTSLQVNQYLFNADENPVTRVRNILRSDDVLLSLPEPLVYNHQTLKGILLSSYRLNKPVISYSPAHVDSGALASIFISPAQIGEQIARTLNKLLAGRLSPRHNKQYAQDFEIKINHQVAHSLQIRLPTNAEILQQMRKGESK